MSLEKYRIPPGQGPFPTAEQHNGVLDHLLRNLIVGFVEEVRDPVRFRHKWKVSVEPLGEREGSTLDPEKTWRVNIVDGVMNDALPTIPYRRKGDPRGWTVPDGYVTDPPTSSSAWIDRDVIDDLDDPPFLVLRETQDFRQIGDDQRRRIEDGAFCSAEDWERELWRAHVVLSATALTINTSPGLPPPSLKRLRLYATALLPATVLAPAGIAFELATLYLLRDPNGVEPSELKPRQREYWPIWTEIVQPAAALTDLIGGLGDGQGGLNDLIADQEAGRIAETLEGTASVEAWTT